MWRFPLFPFSLSFRPCSFFLPSSLYLSILPFLTSRGSNPPRAEHRIGDVQSSRVSLSFSCLFTFSLFLSSFELLSFSFSFCGLWEFSFILSLFLSLYFSFLSLSISLYYFDLLLLLIPALSRSSSWSYLHSTGTRSFKILETGRCSVRADYIDTASRPLARDNRPPYITASELRDSTNRYIAVSRLSTRLSPLFNFET